MYATSAQYHGTPNVIMRVNTPKSSVNSKTKSRTVTTGLYFQAVTS